MEQSQFILTAFGKDRPGIVAQIAEIIFENQCNLEDSNMGHLADEFTLILLLSGRGENLEQALSRDLKRLEREKGISAFIRPVEYAHPANGESGQKAVIGAEGVDQAGIVYKISRLLADRDVNIETLASRKKYSPNSGTAMYDLEIKASLPLNISPAALSDDLEELGNELNVDIRLG